MNVDAELRVVGVTGWIQNLNFLMFGMGLTLSAIQLTSIAITIDQAIPYTCKPPTSYSADQTPPTPHASDDLDGCHMYVVLNGTLTENTTTCENGWEYNTQREGETSVVTDLDLVCDRSFLAGTLMSVHFIGVLIGGFLTGQVADVFGRRPVSIVSLLLMSVLGIAMSFTWNYKLMTALRLLLGIAIPGNSLVSYIRAVEMAPTKNRLLGHIIIQHFWSLGVILVGPIAYLLPDWRDFQLATSLMCLPVVPLMWFFTYESLRWLVQKGRSAAARAILQRIAKSKGIEYDSDTREPGTKAGLLPDDVIMTSTASTSDATNHSYETEHHVDATADKTTDASQHIDARKKYTVLDLFRTKVLMKHTIIIFICWFIMNATYFAFIVYSTSLAGNKYLIFFLLALVEAPVYIVDFFIVRRFGRRRPLMFFHLAGALACLLLAFLPTITAGGTDLSALFVALAMIGKFYVNATFELTLLVGAEIFPTMLRNIATGSASTIGRVGGITAPFILALSAVRTFLPMTILGSFSLIASALVFLLPETKNKPLPETYQDATSITKDRSRESAI